jgi:hypothetical protein
LLRYGEWHAAPLLVDRRRSFVGLQEVTKFVGKTYHADSEWRVMTRASHGVGAFKGDAPGNKTS